MFDCSLKHGEDTNALHSDEFLSRAIEVDAQQLSQ